MFNWIIEIDLYFRIFMVSLFFVLLIRIKDWWSLPVIILMFLLLLSAIPVAIIENNLAEIIIVVPVGIVSIIIILVNFVKRLKSNISIFEGKGIEIK